MPVLKERKMVSKLSSINFFANFEKFSNIPLIFSSLPLQQLLLDEQVNATRQNTDCSSERYYLVTERKKCALFKSELFFAKTFTFSFYPRRCKFSYDNEC